MPLNDIKPIDMAGKVIIIRVIITVDIVIKLVINIDNNIENIVIFLLPLVRFKFCFIVPSVYEKNNAENVDADVTTNDVETQYIKPIHIGKNIEKDIVIKKGNIIPRNIMYLGWRTIFKLSPIISIRPT